MPSFYSPPEPQLLLPLQGLIRANQDGQHCAARDVVAALLLVIIGRLVVAVSDLDSVDIGRKPSEGHEGDGSHGDDAGLLEEVVEEDHVVALGVGVVGG